MTGRRGGQGVDMIPARSLRTPWGGAAHRAALMRSYPSSVLDPSVEYGFRSVDPAIEAKDAITRSLGVYVVGPPATTQAELDQKEFSELPSWCLNGYVPYVPRSKRGDALYPQSGRFLWCSPLAKPL
ncbi:hypothetical protein Plhal710r2_c076g0179381 [Plasmopara halstedii]